MGKITWLGHAAFEIQLANKTILIDPWLNGNPKAAVKASDIKRADLVCVTHDHEDHFGDVIDICKRTGATFVGTFELSVFVQEQGVKDVVGINIGGTTEVNGVSVSIVQAFHTCKRGFPTGFILKAKDMSVYHAGDTGLFGDMQLIGEIHRPNIALIPIGGYYTMGAREAAEAVRLLKPSVVIPMHYLTFPVLAQSADAFANFVREKASQVKVVVLAPGETYEF